jgi:Fe2+ transport system protein FeoA
MEQPVTSPEVTSLRALRPGQRARVTAVASDDSNASDSRRLLELGILPGEAIELIGFAPLGDPMAVLVRGSRIAIRARDARLIQISPL